MAADHPLDPLSPEEMRRARDTLRDADTVADAVRFMKITLEEPSKDAVKAFEAGEAEIERHAFVVLRDPEARETLEAVVDVEAGTVASLTEVPGKFPIRAVDEIIESEATIKQDERFREAVRRRGVEDMEAVVVDPWPAGWYYIPPEIDRDRRLAHGIAYLREEPHDNYYARPLTGIHAWIDIDEMAVLKVEDHGPVDDEQPIPPEVANYRPEDRDLRDDLEPYDVVQPDGPSWEVDGQVVEWQNWRIRVGWTFREGLVLYNVQYDDGDGHRDIVYRASVSEVCTPYGDPDRNERFKNIFDVGEGNLGRLANSLVEDCDCLGYMHYWDGTTNDAEGNVSRIPNAICLHEEDYGTLWKHTDLRTEHAEVRRNRRLVISFIATVGNYDFAFYWYFYQDGSIQGQVRLTGTDNVAAVGPDDDVGGYAELVAPQLKAPIHQHFFNFRLDLDVDGTANRLYEVQNETVPYGPDGFDPQADVDGRHLNPGGNAFYADQRLLESESAAKRLIDPLRGRYWKVTNPDVTNRLDRPVGYKLVPSDNVAAAAQEGSSILRRAGFIRYHLWATPYRPDERYAGGAYPNQHPGGEGLPAWTEADRGLVDEDLVLWYTLGVNHVTRPEDWPVLPVQLANFKLEPINFFGESPAVDVPPEHLVKDDVEHDH